MEATLKWNLFVKEEIPLIKKMLKSDQASETRNALKKLFGNINSKDRIFDTIGYKPESNTLIPSEDNELLNWAKKVDEKLGILLTRVNNDTKDYNEEALKQAKLADTFLEKNVKNLKSDLIDNYGTKTDLLQNKDSVPTLKNATDCVNASFSNKLLPQGYRKYKSLNEIYKEVIQAELPRLTCSLTYMPSKDQVPVKIDQQTMLLLKTDTMRVLPTFSIMMKNNTMGLHELEKSDSLICGSMVKPEHMDKRCYKYMSKQVDPSQKNLLTGLIPTTLDYNIQPSHPIKLNALQPLNLTDDEFIWFSKETACAFIILDKKDTCKLEHYTQTHFDEYLNEHPENKDQNSNQELVSEAFKALPQESEATHIAIRLPAELFCIQNLKKLFEDDETEKRGKLKLPVNINNLDAIDYCDSYAMSAVGWILSTFCTRLRETTLSKYCKHMKRTRCSVIKTHDELISNLKYFDGTKQQLNATAPFRIIDFNEHPLNRRTKWRNFNKGNHKIMNFTNRCQNLTTFITCHDYLQNPGFWKNARTYAFAAGTYNSPKEYMTFIKNDLEPTTNETGYNDLLEKLHSLGGRQNTHDAIKDAIKFVAPEHRALVDDTFMDLLDESSSAKKGKPSTSTC